MRLPAAAALAAAFCFVTVSAQAKVIPTRVQVSAKEFYFSLYPRTVPAGPAIVELVNFGEDPHDLRMQRIGGGRLWKWPVVFPGVGAFSDKPVTLVKGRYLLWCSIANHRQLGMETVLTVVPRKR